MISEEGNNLVKKLMMTTGGDPVEWKENYDTLIDFILQLEKCVSEGRLLRSQNKALLHEKDRLEGKLKYFQNKLTEYAKIEGTLNKEEIK